MLLMCSKVLSTGPSHLYGVTEDLIKEISDVLSWFSCFVYLFVRPIRPLQSTGPAQCTTPNI